MRRAIVAFLAVIGFLAILFVGAAVAAGVYFLRAPPPPMPERVVLTLDLREAPSETQEPGPLGWLGLRRELTQGELLLILDRAARDPRVVGLLARLGGGGPGFAQAQEVRDAVAAFRERGKFALAFSDSFGELGPGTRGYYLATAFDEIHLQPLGFLGLTGLMIEAPFAQELLAELGVTFQLEQRGPYKATAEHVTRSGLSPEHREMLEWLADDLIAQVAQGIAAGRGKEEAEVRRLIDGGPYIADEALAGGLVDALSYHDEAAARALERAGDGARPLSIIDYANRLEPEVEGAAVVALIHGAGQIVRGESEAPLMGGLLMGGDTVAEALNAAIEDPAVRAIVFRIDTGGGSAVASETIAREVRRAVAAGKPVIASMGNTAASGGYWIAMDASRIVAAPGTLTGSIGVLAGKPVLADLFDRVGITWETVQRGANADMFSVFRGFTPDGQERLQAFLDATYGAFVEGVARGRNLPEDEAQAAAGGRVWTGAQAAELGLVDELGGFARALEVAREALELAPDEPMDLRPFPPPRTPFDELVGLLPGRFGAVAPLDALAAWLRPSPLSAPPLVLR